MGMRKKWVIENKIQSKENIFLKLNIKFKNFSDKLKMKNKTN